MTLEGILGATHILSSHELEEWSEGLENVPVSRLSIRAGVGCSWKRITPSHLEKGLPFSSQPGLFQQGEPQVGAVFNARGTCEYLFITKRKQVLGSEPLRATCTQ